LDVELLPVVLTIFFLLSLGSAGQDGYEMEEGEIVPPEVRSGSSTSGLDPSNSFLFDQGSSSQDEMGSAENMLRISQQVSSKLIYSLKHGRKEEFH
jgi:hypothetical protein